MAEANKVVEITQKILSVSVAKPGEAPVVAGEPALVVVKEQLNEKIRRPQTLEGRTYKINVPEHVLSSALYMTINDIVLNEGTEHQTRQPFEVFFASKDTKAFQWVSALSLLISAIFRKGGDVKFLIDELKSVSDPNGGYFSAVAHGMMPSIVAHIGYTIEEHFKYLGIIKVEKPILDTHQQAFVEERKQEFFAAGNSADNMLVCSKCDEKAVVVNGGCPTCTACGDSKCG
jgi:hypothetical protein